MKFKDFNLHRELQKGIDDAGYSDCMPVQEQVLKNAFSGQDLYVQSQTGTGKTAAFLTVIFQRMMSEEKIFKRKALIMAPTRELAVQIEEEAKVLGRYLPFITGSFYGGVGYTQQEKLLRRGAQILVGTPGRVLDLNKSGKMNLMDIAFLVIDEADRMFDMGFYPDLRKLIKVVPPADRRQTMLFSATLNTWVKNLAWEYTKSPCEIEIQPENITVEEISQILYHVSSEEKMPMLLGILKREQPQSAIVFCNTKKYAEIVAKRLRLNGYSCEFIIGDLPQVKRLKIIEDVKAGKTKILIATDVAARGLDIDDLSMVINYDVPTEAENYVHRIGRTARAGKSGRAITLASEQDVYELPAIERFVGKKLPSEIAGKHLFEEDKSAGQKIFIDTYDQRTGNREKRTEKRSHGLTQNFKSDKSKKIKSKIRENSWKSVGKNEKRKHEQPRLHSKTDRQELSPDNLSRLSMEERMAIYKKKYAAGGKIKDKEQSIDKKENSAPSVSSVSSVREKKEEPSLFSVSSVSSVPSVKENKKDGIISKLIGIFKKK